MVSFRGISQAIEDHKVAFAGLCFCLVVFGGASWVLGNTTFLPSLPPQPAAVAQAELWESHVPYEHSEGLQSDGRYHFVANYSASGALTETGPGQHWGRYPMPPVCDIADIYCQQWPAFGAFDAFITGDTSQWKLNYGFNVCDGLCQLRDASGRLFKWDNQQTLGPLTSVPAGTDVTLQWSCQNQQVIHGEGTCIHYEPDFHWCVEHSSGSTATNIYYVGSTGTGFTAGPNVGTAHVHPQTTTTYTLTCNGSPSNNFGDRAMHITIEVSDACPTVADVATDNPDGYRVASADGKVKIPGIGSIDPFCLTNSGAAVFVPAKTAAELQAFINAIPGLAGLTKSSE